MMSVVMAIGRRVLFIQAIRCMVLCRRVEPLHGLQHSRRAGLHRQMHVIAQRWIFVDRVHNLLHEIARMGGREPHAPDARHAPDIVQQRCEVPGRRRRVPITVYVLPQQLDLGITHVSKLPGLGITEALVRLRLGRAKGTTQ